MKTDLYSLTGKKEKKVDLPSQFSEQYRPDLIRRAFLAIRSHKYQIQTVNPLAGKRKGVELSKRRRKYRTTYGRGQSRTPRKVMWRIGSHFGWEGSFVPFAKGGRVAHPPKANKKIREKVNVKERRKAIRSAIAATAIANIVKKRGHQFENVPIVIDSKIETLKKTKEIKDMLLKLGLKKELIRSSVKKVRAGKGKMRTRKYKRAVGPLIVVSKDLPVIKAANNISGVDAVVVKNLNAELLAPGGQAGRLTIWSESAINELKEKRLFQ